MTQLSRMIKAVAIAILIPLIFAGCAHTDLPEQEVPPAPVGTAKLPVKIAVLADPTMSIHQPLGFYEKLNPGLANTVRDALAVDFEKVDVVDDRLSASDADLLAMPAAEVHFSSKRPCKLTITFVDPHTGKAVAEISSAKPLDDYAPGRHQHVVTDSGTEAAIVTAALFVPGAGLAFIPAMPYLEKHDADRFNARFGPTLVAMATDIATKASKDQAIKSLAIHPAPPSGKPASNSR